MHCITLLWCLWLHITLMQLRIPPCGRTIVTVGGLFIMIKAMLCAQTLLLCAFNRLTAWLGGHVLHECFPSGAPHANPLRC
jgi:hypothetical protein